MWDGVNGVIKQWEQRMFDKGNEELTKPMGRWLKEIGTDLWVWFVDVLPDIAGYGVFATGAIVMLSPLVSSSGMFKPLAVMVGGLIVTVCILATN